MAIKNYLKFVLENKSTNSNQNIFGVCAVLFLNDKILSVSRRDNYNDWALPGGKVDPGETPTQAIIREVREETGLIITENDIEVISDFVDSSNDKIARAFLIKSYKGTITHTDGEGLIDYKSWDDIINGTFGDFNKKLKVFMEK